MPRKIFATSEVILETSPELSIEADGAVDRLLFLEEGRGSSIKTKRYFLIWERVAGFLLFLFLICNSLYNEARYM